MDYLCLMDREDVTSPREKVIWGQNDRLKLFRSLMLVNGRKLVATSNLVKHSNVGF